MDTNQQRLIYEAESIANRARDIISTAYHLLYGVAHSDRDCIDAVLSIPAEAFPDDFQPLAKAVRTLADNGNLIDYTTLARCMYDAGVENGGSLVASLAEGADHHISCAPDLDARAILKAFAVRDSANKLGLISEIAAKGDLEAARHAFADLAPFEYAPMPPSALPIADVENAGPIPAPLFEDGVYPGVLNLFIGESNAGKSMLALTAALSLATGRTLVKAFKPLAAGKVVYLSGEDDRAILKQRLADITRAHGLEQTGAPIHFIDEVSPLITFDAAGLAHLTDGWRELNRRARDYRLIVVDPLVTWFALTSENDAAQMGRLAEILKGLAADTGAAILVTHHTNKSGAANLDQNAARGSTALTSAARFVANVARPSQTNLEQLGLAPEDAATYVRFAVSKNSYGPTTGAPCILQRVEGGALVDADPGAVRRGDLAESLAGILAETGAHLTRREIIQGRGELAAEVRKRLVEAEGAVSRHDLEKAIVHGLSIGLLREEKLPKRHGFRVEVVPNE